MEQTLRQYLELKDELERSVGKMLLIDIELIPDDITVDQFIQCVNVVLDTITMPKYH